MQSFLLSYIQGSLFLLGTKEMCQYGILLYSKIQANQAAISIDYLKTYFDKSDIRPEMYFEATRYDTVGGFLYPL